MYGLLSRLLSRELSVEEAKALGYDADELACDFARVFLAAGIADGKAAFPYESVYTSSRHLMMQEAWEEVRSIYASNGVTFGNVPAELKEDHIALELQFMDYLVKSGASEAEQHSFIKNHLANWVPAFADDIVKYANTKFYKDLGQTLKEFIADACKEKESASASQNTVGSYELSKEAFDEALQTWKDAYEIYAPKQCGEVIKYAKVESLSEIVYDKQSDFSPKESYYPISQTMFYFTENDVIESTLKSDKGIMIFARPCDINAMERLDQIFLKNGEADSYYARLREKVKVVMLECREGFEHCFCVSVGTNKTDNYDLAVRFDAEGVKIKAKTAGLVPASAKAGDFEPEFVTENAKKIKTPQMKDKETLKWASELDYWNQFDEKCIGCGGCNTVCGSCSCFDTVDIIYKEGSKEGERKRVWSSCMLEDFTQTAGGGRARKTPGANMRFKVFHKFYDFNARFGGEKHMCVGCGRCTRRCPAEIDFFETVNNFADILERR